MVRKALWDTIPSPPGTNDITNNVDTAEMLQTLVNDVNKESPDKEIAISGLVTRKDKPGIEKKVSNLNSPLKNLCARNQLYFIENDRVDASCLDFIIIIIIHLFIVG